MTAPLPSVPLPSSRRSSSQIEARMNVSASRSSSIALSNLNSLSAKPVGIVNEGNTCFFGSVMQSLAATGSLIELLGPVIFPPEKEEAEEEEEIAAEEKEDAPEGNNPGQAELSGVETLGKEQQIKSPTQETASPIPFIQPHTVTSPTLSPDNALTIPRPSLLHRTPSNLNIPHHTPSLPPSSLIPSLRDEALILSNAKLLPVTLAFERSLGRAWKAKDGVIKGALEKEGRLKEKENARRDSAVANGTDSAEKEQQDKEKEKKAKKDDDAKALSFKTLLRELAKKYDQYADYRQQDAHELLRHLLDSMSMEEFDLIKVLQPTPPEPPLQPGEKRIKKRRNTMGKGNNNPWKEGERMVPFADALFGGSLVSMVICEGCKNVSHTYEGFLDMSLSLKSTPVARKRDKFRSLFKRGGSGKDKDHHSGAESPTGQPFYLEGVHSDQESAMEDVEGEGMKSDGGAGRARDVEGASKSGLESRGTHRDSSPSAAGGGLQKRSSFHSWTGRRTSKSMTDMAAVAKDKSFPRTSSGEVTPPVAPHRHISNLKSTPSTRAPSSKSSTKSEVIDDPTVPPKPSREQAAYIRRILNGPTLPDKHDDPLERLRQGMANMQSSSGGTPGSSGMHQLDPAGAKSSNLTGGTTMHIEGFGTDLMECLRNFTSVEVMEGDNAFACHKCWKYKAGRVDKIPTPQSALSDPVAEEDEDDDDDADEVAPVQPKVTKAPSFALPDSSSSALSSSALSLSEADGSERTESIPTFTVTGTEDDDSTRATSFPSEASAPRSSFGSLQAPSPMLKAHKSSGESSEGGSSGYLTSEGETSDEAPSPLAFSRPPMAPRRKSTRFVLQRAFKRYWIARPPPVMVFHFKRFQQTGKANNIYSTSFSSLKKLDDYVSFPEILDISPFLAPSRTDYRIAEQPDGQVLAPYTLQPPGDHGPALTPVRYKLYAVVVHLGSSTLAGHYIAYVLTEPTAILGTAIVGKAGAEVAGPASPATATNGKGEKTDTRVWHFCSDHQTRLASIEEVLQSKAYMCFYERW